MIRLIVTTHDSAVASHIGGPVEVWSQIFEVDHPALEAALRPANDYQVKVLTVERTSVNSLSEFQPLVEPLCKVCGARMVPTGWECKSCVKTQQPAIGVWWLP